MERYSVPRNPDGSRGGDVAAAAASGMSGAGIVFRKIRHFHLVITITAQQLPPTADSRAPAAAATAASHLPLPPAPAPARPPEQRTPTYPGKPPARPANLQTHTGVLALTGGSCQTYHPRSRHTVPVRPAGTPQGFQGWDVGQEGRPCGI